LFETRLAEGNTNFIVSKDGHFLIPTLPEQSAAPVSVVHHARSHPRRLWRRKRQLGLKLELRKRLIPMLMIDHMEEKSTGN